MKRVAFVSVAVMFIMIAFLVGTAEATGQETCPDGGDWVKVDGLSGYTYTYTPAAGYTVTDNCYKHSTYVHYGTGATVTADGHKQHRTIWHGWEPGSCSGHVICEERTKTYELSHASFKLTYTPPPVCEDETANNYGGPLPCTYDPPPVCEDPLANNVGGPLPCTYDPVLVCEDPEANNQGQPLPCTYDPVLCEDPLALNYQQEGECLYPKPTPPPPYCPPYNVGTWYECNTGNSTWSAPSASKCWCQGLTGRVHYHTTYDCGKSYVTEGNWDDAPDWLGHYPGEVCPIGGC